jgi:hypothetical protein
MILAKLKRHLLVLLHFLVISFKMVYLAAVVIFAVQFWWPFSSRTGSIALYRQYVNDANSFDITPNTALSGSNTVPEGH